MYCMFFEALFQRETSGKPPILRCPNPKFDTHYLSFSPVVFKRKTAIQVLFKCCLGSMSLQFVFGDLRHVLGSQGVKRGFWERRDPLGDGPVSSARTRASRRLLEVTIFAYGQTGAGKPRPEMPRLPLARSLFRHPWLVLFPAKNPQKGIFPPPPPRPQMLGAFFFSWKRFGGRSAQIVVRGGWRGYWRAFPFFFGFRRRFPYRNKKGASLVSFFSGQCPLNSGIFVSSFILGSLRVQVCLGDPPTMVVLRLGHKQTRLPPIVVLPSLYAEK